MTNNFNRLYNEALTEGIKAKAIRNLFAAGVLGAGLVGSHINKDEVPRDTATLPHYETDGESEDYTRSGTESRNRPLYKEIIPERVLIDIDKIIKIESHGRSKAKSSAGARGLMQIMPKTWEDAVSKMGKTWDYATYVENPKVNREVGTYYMNVVIPRYLKHFKIPDSVNARLAAYNAGVGNVLKAMNKDSENWVQHLPRETRHYIVKYNN